MSQYIKDYHFKYNGFSGSFEVFYLFIKSQKIDITTIELAYIVFRFLSSFNPERKGDIFLASELALYLSELVLFKVRSLLGYGNDDSEEENDYLIEPKDVPNIVEYALFKEIAKVLESYEEKEFFVLKRENGNYSQWVELTANDIAKAFVSILKKKDEDIEEEVIELEATTLTVSDVIDEIRGLLSCNEKISFPSLFEGKNRIELIVIFLAILELARLREIIIKQHRYFDTIYIFRREKNLEEEHAS